MSEHVRILDDPNPVYSLYFGEDQPSYVVNDDAASSHGACLCRKIEAYSEPGQCADVPWFIVVKQNGQMVRVNAALVQEVAYKQEPTDGKTEEADETEV